MLALGQGVSSAAMRPNAAALSRVDAARQDTSGRDGEPRGHLHPTGSLGHTTLKSMFGPWALCILSSDAGLPKVVLLAMLGLSLKRWVLCRRVSLGLGQNPGRVSSEDGATGLCSASWVVSEHRARALVKSPPRRKLWWHGTGAGSGSHHHSHGTKPGPVAAAEEAVWCRNSCCCALLSFGTAIF